MKGKERENSTFVYLSVVKERGQREQGAERAGRGSGGGAGGVGGWFCPMALDLKNKKRNRVIATKRGCAINITPAAKCSAKEVLKGVGTQMQPGRYGGIFMGKNAAGFVCYFRV